MPFLYKEPNVKVEYVVGFSFDELAEKTNAFLESINDFPVLAVEFHPLFGSEVSEFFGCGAMFLNVVVYSERKEESEADSGLGYLSGWFSGESDALLAEEREAGRAIDLAVRKFGGISLKKGCKKV